MIQNSEHSSQPSTLSDNFSAEFDAVDVPPLRRYVSEPARPGTCFFFLLLNFSAMKFFAN